MFAQQIRQAVLASPRVELPKVSSALWKAFAAGGVTEEEASELSALLEARKAVPPPRKPVQRRVGSRPRSPASMARRRSWAASGRLPPRLAALFTLAEQAVLAVIAVEVERAGACTLTLGHIAALAGICRASARNALREAHRLGLVRVEERRLTAWRNAPNKVTITSPEWTAWIRLRRAKGGGGKFVHPTSTKFIREKSETARIGECNSRWGADGSRRGPRRCSG